MRLFEDLVNHSVHECLFLLAEMIVGGITPNEVLGNIFNTLLGIKFSMMYSSMKRNQTAIQLQI